MDLKYIFSKVDHTFLKVDAKFSDIKNVCDQAIKYGAASACIAPSFVKDAKDYVKENLKICTVIGFPNGYNTLKSKVFETEDAIKNGADEIDMVINIGKLKDKDFRYIQNEIEDIKKVCGSKILKVIIETCLLSDDEKIKMCEIISNSGADFIKTSTGFSKNGADLKDIILFKKYISENVKIKAAGGIRSLEAAKDFLNAGADRLGASGLFKFASES